MVLKIYITFQSKYQNSINLCHQQPDKRLYDTTCFPSLANVKKNQNENNFYSNGNNHTIYIRYFLIFNIETNQRKILKSIQQCLGISIYRETHLKTFSAIEFFLELIYCRLIFVFILLAIIATRVLTRISLD